VPSFGGTSYWVRGRQGLDSEELAQHAAEKGVLIEPGRVTFGVNDAPRNFYRLAFSSIEEQKIEPGVRILADLVRR
jgi:GntR family transcriptional regulator/MocR family aminotransferase